MSVTIRALIRAQHIKLSSAARTTPTTTADQVNYNGRGLILILTVTANPGGAETLTVSIQAKVNSVATYKTIISFAVTAAAANDTYVYMLYPGAVETAATGQLEIQGLPAPRSWRATVTHSASGSWTYQLESQQIV